MSQVSAIVEQAEMLNDEGKFDDALVLLTSHLINEKKAVGSPEECQDRFRGMYLYTEALLHSGRMSEAKDFADYLQELDHNGYEKLGLLEEANELQRFIESIFRIYNPKWGQLAAIRSMGSLSEDSEGKDPEFVSRCRYFFALADYRDYNVVDARRKLPVTSESSSPFYNQQVRELHRKIEERSGLDFQELRQQHRAFIEIGEHDAWIENLCLNADGTILAVMYRDGILKLLHTKDGAEIASFDENVPLYQEEKAEAVGLAFSPDSRYLAVGLGIGIVKVYNVVQKRLHTEYSYPGLNWEQLPQNAYYREYTHVSYSEKGTYLVIVPTAENYDPQGDRGYPTPDYYGTFYVVDVLTGQLVLQHTYQGEKIASILISPDEKLLAVALFGKDLDVWDLPSSEVIARHAYFVWIGLPSRMRMIDAIAFTKDSKKLIFSASDSFVVVLDIDRGYPIYKICLENRNHCCALLVDSQDAVVLAEYAHNDSGLIRKWPEESETVETLFTSPRSYVDKIVISEERDEIWIYSDPVVEVRKYSTSELIKRYDPYQWSYSYFAISNTVSINAQFSIVAISHENKIRLG